MISWRWSSLKMVKRSKPLSAVPATWPVALDAASLAMLNLKTVPLPNVTAVEETFDISILHKENEERGVGGRHTLRRACLPEAQRVDRAAGCVGDVVGELVVVCAALEVLVEGDGALDFAVVLEAV
jgi:hypothetical protein